MSQASSATRKLAAVMFADIVGYTAMMQENEQRAKHLRDRHREVIEHVITERGGEIVQYYGDGTLSTFSSAKEAVLGALEIQLEMHKEPRVPVRIGIHLGDFVQDEGGIYGDCVNVAARVESLAVPGAVLFSDKVYRELENHPSIRSTSLGEFELKNVRRPVEVFALVNDGITVPGKDDVSPGKHKRVNQTIAVLPFACRSPHNEGEYFADGIAEEIISGLTKVEGLSTISRTSCLALMKNVENLNAVARESNVSHLLEGSVRMAGNKVRVSVQLSNASDGFQVWSEVFERELDDIFAVQDEIARHVVNGMKVSFAPPSSEERIVEQPTENLEAYKLYLKGVHHWNRRNPESVQKASQIFGNALELDPEFSSARCGLSHCYAFLGSCGILPPTQAYAEALQFAMTAIENNPKNAEAHLAMANIKFYNYWDWKGAYESLQKAESLGLNSALLHQSFGIYYIAIGKPELGVSRMEKALEQDPLSVPMINMMGNLLLFNEQYDEAIEAYNETLELDPEFRGAIQARGVALVCQGKFKEALKDFEEYHARVNKPRKALTGLIICHHKLGNHALVNEYKDRLYERLENDANAAVEIDIALAHSGTGEYDQAIDFLHRVYEKRFSVACMGVIWIMRCPYFKGLQQHPRYHELLERMGMG